MPRLGLCRFQSGAAGIQVTRLPPTSLAGDVTVGNSTGAVTTPREWRGCSLLSVRHTGSCTAGAGLCIWTLRDSSDSGQERRRKLKCLHDKQTGGTDSNGQLLCKETAALTHAHTLPEACSAAHSETHSHTWVATHSIDVHEDTHTCATRHIKDTCTHTSNGWELKLEQIQTGNKAHVFSSEGN